MSIAEHGAPAQEQAEPDGLWQWLKALPGRYQLLTAAAATLTAFLPQSVVPEPLHALRAFGTTVVVVAFLLTWAGRKWVRKQLRPLVGTTAALLFTLIVVHQVFVKPVRYRTIDKANATVETVWFVTGWSVVDPTLARLTAEDQIRTAGGGWDELQAIWGGSFVAVALAYSLLYLLVINGLILSLGGTDFAQPRPKAKTRRQ